MKGIQSQMLSRQLLASQLFKRVQSFVKKSLIEVHAWVRSHKRVETDQSS
jgi:hypothetical protein